MARHSTGAWFRKAKNAWYAKIDGKQIPLGVKGKENEKAARAAWHGFMANGRPEPPPTPAVIAHSVASKPPPPAVVPSVAAVVAGFLADAGGRVKPNTLAAYTGLLTPLSGHFAAAPASDFTPAMLLMFANRPEWGPSHRHNVIGAVQTAFRWAATNGVIQTNPVVAVKRPAKRSRGREAVVDAGGHGKLLAAATPALHSLLMFLHATGARPGEAARVTAADVDFQNNVVVLTDHKTAGQTGRPRLIIIPAAARDLFY